MRKVRKSPLLITALAAAPAPAAAAAELPIAYRVSMSDPRTHEFEVEMRIPALAERAAVEIVFPAWAPGSYMVRDFARHVYGLAVTDARGKPLATERLDKQRWRVTSGGAAFVVRYRVFAFEPSVRTSYLDESHGFWNGSSLFFYVDGEVDRPCELEVVPPRRSPAWKVATALPAAGRSGPAARRFRAADFDELVDSPVEVGSHETLGFKIGATSFEIALAGRTNADRGRLVADLRKIAAATGDLFGGFPFDRYVFIVHALPAASGGLEHRASVALDIAGMAFEDEKAYQNLAALCAHEFFHAWNVKRIHDVALGPFDYTRENYTRLLWLHEGFTDYMARVLLLRAGIWKPKDFLKWIGEEWPKYLARPGRNAAPLSELSFEAWIKEYKPAENHMNAAISYYTKGLWAGMTLDLMLRLRTDGLRGLADFFRVLWEAHGRPGMGITEADVRAAAAATAGGKVDDFFDKYVHGIDELPVPDLLRRAGLEVHEPRPWEAPEPPPTEGDGKSKEGKKPLPEPERDRVKEERTRAWAGVTFDPTGRKALPTSKPGSPAVVKNVIPGAPAFAAGLTFGDEVVAVDGYRVDADSFGKRIADRRPGETVTVSYFRADELRHTRMKLVENPERRLVVKPDPKADAKAQAVRKGWLGE